MQNRNNNNTVKKVLAAFSKFVYEFMFIDQTSGKISTSKYWMNVGYAVITISIIVNLFKPLNLDANLLMVYAGTVLGSRALEKWLLQRMGHKEDKSLSSE